jgi:hypothetical protein
MFFSFPVTPCSSKLTINSNLLSTYKFTFKFTSTHVSCVLLCMCVCVCRYLCIYFLHFHIIYIQSFISYLSAHHLMINLLIRLLMFPMLSFVVCIFAKSQQIILLLLLLLLLFIIIIKWTDSTWEVRQVRYFKRFLLIVCSWVCCHCLQTYQKRASDLFTDGCEPPCGCWYLNSGPLEEQSVLLTAEPSFQLPTSRICFCVFVCLFCFVFRDRVSLYSLGCPGTHFVDQAGLELRNPPASASQVLRLMACATTPGSDKSDLKLLKRVRLLDWQKTWVELAGTLHWFSVVSGSFAPESLEVLAAT